MMLNSRRLVLMVLTSLLLAGCAAVGVVSQRVFGPPSIEAKHKLAQIPTLILVENYRSGSAMQFDCESLTRELTAQFDKLKLAPLVDADRIYLLRDNDPKAFRAMKIPAIGRACGAEQVVYVDLLDLGVGMQEYRNNAQGAGAARVRVVDAKNGNTLWPLDAAEGYPVAYSVKITSGGESYNSMRNKVINGAADRITRLFYKYKPDEVPE